VDDEPLSRELLRDMLARERDIDVVGECSDGRQAIESIHALRPDLVFLDIQMPEQNGFQVIESLGPGSEQALESPVPAIIFVTAYESISNRSSIRGGSCASAGPPS
jgi:two-component system LytT family response regulator